MKTRMPFILLGFSLLLLLLYRVLPGFMDTVYSGFIYRFLAQGVSSVMALIPFSLAEIVLYLLVPFLLFYLVRGVVRLAAGPYARAAVLWKKYLRNLGLLMVWGISVFLLTTGVHYHRLPLEDHLGLTVEPSAAEELHELAGEIVRQVNQTASFTRRSPEGNMIPEHTFSGYRKDIMKAYDSLAVNTGLKVGGYYPSTKPVMASRGMSYAFVSGFFFPWTLEANVNKDIPVFLVPAVMTHEQAHVRGFMRENEANFLTYLVVRHTTNTDLKYSCLLHSLNYLLHAVYNALPDQYEGLMKSLSPRVLHDLAQNRAYWEPFRSSFSEMSRQVNDAYLKANSQRDGIASYGKVVDLMIADHKFSNLRVQQNPETSVCIGEGTL
ncbi:MAG: DUF3810 domain-containing protein [Bacteroidales bacterium]|jgi:hypothetical protein|nr:DUF3810 domain-containing protein [Bacteroidales bacterium]MDD3944517.1 DUF3810 domain-containing protein [Bacteroidales bacterium]MDY0358670.1 DUF3810 domain-containing protein [Bacteroidales bacterium]